MRSAWAKTLLAALVVLSLDLGTKAFVAGSYYVGEKDALFSSLSIFHMQNPGVSFGLFQQMGFISDGVQLPIVFLVSAVFLGTCLILFMTALWPFLWFPAGLALGGAFGNISELLYHGYATDFIYVDGLPGPANLADIFMITGTILFFLYDLRLWFGRPSSLALSTDMNDSKDLRT